MNTWTTVQYIHPGIASTPVTLYTTMPSPTAYTIYLFGITAFIAGVYTLLAPSANLETLDLPMACLPAAYGNGLAAVGMGIYYTLAAYQDNRTFFSLTVPMRGLTATVFWIQGGPWRMAALWEGGGAVLTGLVMALERYQGRLAWNGKKRA